MVAKRTGRLPHLAFDETPIDTDRPDLDSRIGWLLATSRLHHPDPTVRDGRQFTESLADAGVLASRSLVSRWESGSIAVPYEALAGYEKVMGTPEDTLTSTVSYLRSALPGARDRLVRPRLDPSAPSFADRLDQLISHAEDDAARPAEWQELGWHLSLVPRVHLRGTTWQRLALNLVAKVPRGVEVAFRQLSTAMMHLARVERATPHLVGAISSYLHEPDVQVVNNPLGQLDLFDTRAAAALVLEFLDNPPDSPAFRTALWTASQKLRRGQFTDEELARIQLIVLARWRSDPSVAADQLAELIAELPPGVRETLVAGATHLGRRRLAYVIDHAELIPGDRARTFSESLAKDARSGLRVPATYRYDPMLPRLIREGLFHRSSECRYHASWLIAASPFADAVDQRVLTLLEDPGLPRAFRVSLAAMGGRLGAPDQRARVIRLLTDSAPEVIISGARALGHLPYADLSDRALQQRLSPEHDGVGRALLYALGMTGSPAVERLAGAAPELWQRQAATWWLQAGPAVVAR